MADSKMQTDESGPSAKKNDTELDAAHIRSQIQTAEAQIQQGDTNAGLEAFMAVEKQCRLAEDLALSKETCLALVNSLHAAGKWDELLENITVLTKRRGQLKSAVQAIVRRATEILDSVDDQQRQIDLIKALQAVTEGKMFVEIDRARLTKRLAHIYERDGRAGDAADAMQEVAVETFGAMHKSEKIAYVLEQMRLCMDNGDFTRAQILSRKVSPKAFAAGAKEQEAGEMSLQGTAIEAPATGTPTMAELKGLYYRSMIRFHKHSNNYIEIVRCLLALYGDADTAARDKEGGGGGERAAEAYALLKQIVWYLVLCPAYSTEEGAASDYLTLRATTAADPRLGDIPDHQDLLTIFTTEEVTGASALLERYQKEIAAQESIFGGDDGAARREHLRRRITEHNVLAVAQYYGRLRLDRLATLLGLRVAEAESSLAELVVKGAVTAKIDRPAGTVQFGAAEDAAAVLDAWGANIGKLLGLVETACQKIAKEGMQYGVPIGAGA